MGAVGRPKKYTPRKLKEHMEKYLLAHSYSEPLVDDDGNQRINRLGEPMFRVVYPEGISEHELRKELGISKQTWVNYSRDPEFLDPIEDFKDEVIVYKLKDLVAGDPRRQRGTIFTLQCNYGMNPKAKAEVELRPQASASSAAASIPLEEKLRLLREIASDFAEGRISEE